MSPFGFPFGSFMENGRQKGAPGGSQNSHFFDLQPEGAPGPSRTPFPDVFGDHFFMILASILRFLINKSITLKIILWSFWHSFLRFQINESIDLGSFCLIILALILMASDQQKHYNKSNSHAHKPTRTRTRTYTFTCTCTSTCTNTCTRKRTRDRLRGGFPRQSPP